MGPPTSIGFNVVFGVALAVLFWLLCLLFLGLVVEGLVLLLVFLCIISKL